MKHFALLCGMAWLGAAAWAQQAPPPPLPAPAASRASVTYQVEGAQRDPYRTVLTIDFLGHAVYSAQDAPAAMGNADDQVPPYRVEFDVTPATRNNVFALARALNHFHGDFEFRKHAIANTGQKTFTYREGQQESATSFNWSENKDLQQLTALFESIALTQSLARQLAFRHRYDKLGLEELLKRMEELNQENMLGEVQAIAPTLRQVADDTTVMHVTRERANRLLDQVQMGAAARR